MVGRRIWVGFSDGRQVDLVDITGGKILHNICIIVVINWLIGNFTCVPFMVNIIIYDSGDFKQVWAM